MMASAGFETYELFIGNFIYNSKHFTFYANRRTGGAIHLGEMFRILVLCHFSQPPLCKLSLALFSFIYLDIVFVLGAVAINYETEIINIQVGEWNSLGYPPVQYK